MRSNLSTVRSRASQLFKNKLFSGFIKFCIFALRHHGRDSTKLYSLCSVSCFIEVWKRIASSKPIDVDSRLFRDINAVISYYLTRRPDPQRELVFTERMVLTYFSYLAPSATPEDARKHFDFARKHRIADIINVHRGLLALWSGAKMREIESLSKFYDSQSSADYWKEHARVARLPPEIDGNANKIRRFLKKRISRLKRDISEANTIKLDFTPSDVSAFIAISGALLIVISYIRSASLFWHLGIPHSNYFAITDYLAMNINSVSIILASALFSLFSAFAILATKNSYSLGPGTKMKRPRREAIFDALFHLNGALSVVIGVAWTLVIGTINPWLAGFGALYIGMFVIAHFSYRFFIFSMKAYLFIGFAYIAVISSIVGSIIDYQTLLESEVRSPRVFYFSDRTYPEKEWRLVAMTSGFLIMRRQSDGVVHVRPRSELKRIEADSQG